MKRRKIFRLILKLLFACCLFAGGLEVAVRLIAPVDTFVAVPKTWDRLTGLRMIPDARGFITRPEYHMDFQINSHGLREREIDFARPTALRRVLCLGDSYTCGFGVEPDEAFPRRLEGHLNRRDDGETWQVVNAGIGATGTAHQLAWYKLEGHRYGVELVILTICPNDLWDNKRSGLFTLDADSLVQHEAPSNLASRLLTTTSRIPGYHTFWSRSHALNTLKQVFAAAWYGTPEPQAADPTQITSPQTASPRDAESKLMVSLIEEMDRSCRRHGAHMVVMMVPVLPGAPELALRWAALGDDLVADDFDCLNLREDFDRLQRSGVQTCYPDDGHWNMKGHELFAEILFAHLGHEMQ